MRRAYRSPGAVVGRIRIKAVAELKTLEGGPCRAINRDLGMCRCTYLAENTDVCTAISRLGTVRTYWLDDAITNSKIANEWGLL